jgi:hypothetical protein
VENCYSEGWHYHFTEERELKNAYIRDGKLHLGAMSYEKVFVPADCRFESDEQALIDEMQAQGMLISAPQSTKNTAQTAVKNCFVPKQSAWIPMFPTENQYLIEWNRSEDGKLRTTIETKNISGPIKLVFSDPIANLQTNAALRACETKTEYLLFGFGKLLTLEVTTASEKLPFAWLKGNFAVVPVDGWTEFDSSQITCSGKFLIDGSGEKKQLRAGELASQGLPFFGGLLTAQKYVVLAKIYEGTLDFEGLSVAAAHVSIDGKEIGWWWKNRPLAVALTAGEHVITLKAAPSTYNTYGPHHYYLGDCRLTSPDTFFGRGGYTDNPDAPAYTFVDSMQFVTFTLDGDVVLQEG